MGKRGPKPTKAAPLSVRLKPDLRRSLETTASAAGRSLTDEIELRLEMTFDEMLYGDIDMSAIFRATAYGVKLIEISARTRWTEDRWTFDQFRTLFEIYAGARQPGGRAVVPKDKGRPFPGTTFMMPSGIISAEVAAAIALAKFAQISDGRAPIDAHEKESFAALGRAMLKRRKGDRR